MKLSHKSIETRIERLEARLWPSKDWRQMSFNEFISTSAEELRERVFKKLSEDVYDFVCDMSDEDLLHSVVELNRAGVFRTTA